MYSIYVNGLRTLRKVAAFTGLGFSRMTSIDQLTQEQLKKLHVLAPSQTRSFDHDPDACAMLAMQSYVPTRQCAITTHKLFLAELANAYLDLRTGLVCTAQGEIILESGVDAYRIKGSPFYGRLKQASKQLKGGCYTSIWSTFTHNHGHWLIECLPRLYALQQFTDRPFEILMPSGMSFLQQETLAACVPEGMTVRIIDRSATIKAADYLFPSYATSGTAGYLLSSEHVTFMREAMYRKYKLSRPRKRTNRIFISRKNAAYRRILNEHEVIACLSTYGFKSYELEKMPFAQQVELFYDAKVVVSPHNAGLANLLFAEDARVLEVFAFAPEPTFFLTAKSAGHKYFFMFGDPLVSPPFPAWPHERKQLREAINADFYVDIAWLKQQIERVLQW